MTGPAAAQRARPPGDEEAIRRLLARFVQLRDDKRFEEWAALFLPDGVFTYGTVVLVGPDAIRDDVSRLLAGDRGKHLCANSVIDVDGDRARVVSDFVKLRPAAGAEGAGGYEIQVMGRYEDDLRRVDNEWRFARRDVRLPGDAPGG